MKVTSTGNDIFKALQTVISNVKLDYSKLTRVTTHATPVIVRQKKALFSFWKDGNLEISHKIKKIPWIIHQEVLWAKSLQLNKVMDVVVKSVFLLEAQAAFEDLTYFCNV